MPAAKKKTKDDATPTPMQGLYMFPNGDSYDGEYTNSGEGGVMERCGFGTHTSHAGTVYAGNWSADKMSGQGAIEYTTGAKYEGEFVNNQFHGRGKYCWPNGSFYEGQFNENKMEGDGEFKDTEGQIWLGTFRYKAAPGLRFKLNL